MKHILVIGANGQLGQSLRHIADQFPDFSMRFMGRSECDLQDPIQMAQVFKKHTIDICINAAAYTAVDQAEKEPDLAYAINARGTEDLAKLCAAHQVTLAHISTDYVFDGKATLPYDEQAPTAPIGVYGKSKWQGEQAVKEHLAQYYIIRTSWLYGPFGHNFLTTMLRLAYQNKALTITTEQTGVPTSTIDLAQAILGIIAHGSTPYGLYHFSNEGPTTWYGFAQEIFTQSGQIETAQLASTEYYPTFAERPKYSVLDNEKYKTTLEIPVRHWREALVEVMTLL